MGQGRINAKDSGLTVTVLGCGTLGTAILSGLLSSVAASYQTRKTAAADATSAVVPLPSHDVPARLPSRFIACVRREESANTIKEALADFEGSLTVLTNENLRGARAADVVLLGCQPNAVYDVLGEPGMREALRGKLLISILAGITVEQIEDVLYGDSASDTGSDDGERCRVVRAMPNTASFIRESMTLITTCSPPLPPEMLKLTTWIFTSVGQVAHIPNSAMDVCTALCGSGPAFFAMILEALIDGAVAMGIKRTQAQMMAAHTMRGTAGLVLVGEHPAAVREKVTTPGGSTIRGCLLMEEGRIRWTMANVLREATEAASRLGRKE